eukprot:4204088-Prymnesium_polylepis.2
MGAIEATPSLHRLLMVPPVSVPPGLPLASSCDVLQLDDCDAWAARDFKSDGGDGFKVGH